jgi:hypothetical protein
LVEIGLLATGVDMLCPMARCRGQTLTQEDDDDDLDDVPIGRRVNEDLHLYRTPNNREDIEPDQVNAAIEAYFRIPAIWVGEAPKEKDVVSLNPKIHHEVVIRKSLSCGIDVEVQRDGLFLFNFSNWTPAPQVLIPGFTHDPSSYQIPSATTNAERIAVGYGVLRAQAMNAHQACLISSEMIVRGRAAAMGLPVTARETIKGARFGLSPSYPDSIEEPRALVHNVLNQKYDVGHDRPFPRRVIEVDVIEHSLGTLDQILQDPSGQLTQLVEAAYIAASRSAEHRLGEAVTLGFGVCEQLVSVAWAAMLSEKERGYPGRMNKERRDRLNNGRDYSASVMIEFLELSDILDAETYKNLGIARKARNEWAHRMVTPKTSDAHACMLAIKALLAQVKGVELYLQYAPSGLERLWRIWDTDFQAE